MARFLVFEKHVQGLDLLIPMLEDLLGEQGHHIINYHQLRHGKFVSYTAKNETQSELEFKDESFSINDMTRLKVVKKNILQLLFGADTFHKSLAPLMEQFSPDFLMIGPFEDGKSKTQFLKSEMRPLLRQVSCPIFFSSKKSDKVEFKRIVFASDLSREDQMKFRELLKMVQWRNKKLDLLTIDTNNYFTQPDVVMREVIKDMAAEASMQDVSTHFKENSSVKGGIIDFLEHNEIDLLIMCNHSQKKLKHNLWGNALEEIVHQVELPMLIIND